jgi:hypothetical protein
MSLINVFGHLYPFLGYQPSRKLDFAVLSDSSQSCISPIHDGDEIT